MATLIKFRQGNGAPEARHATNGNSIGEPLWDTVAKQLYVTDGDESPRLIGPIPPISLTVTPEYTETDGGPLLATIAINGSPFLIYAPASGSGETSNPQALSVSGSALTLSNGGNSVDFAGSTGNVDVIVTGAAAVTEGESTANAKFTFSANVNVIDGGTWTI